MSPLPAGSPHATAPATVSQALLLALLADARLPSGSHTQSGGLEPALRAGLTTAQVPSYLALRLRTVCLVEAGTAVVARHVAVRGGDLGAVEAAWAARTPSPALRANARLLGRGYQRLLDRLWRDRTGAAPSTSVPPARPIVLGLIAARAGLDAANTARLVGYDDAQTVAAAMLKLEPLDPVVPTSWVLAAHPLIEDLVTEVEHLTEPAQIPACSAPLIEHWAQDHDRTRERLFRA